MLVTNLEERLKATTVGGTKVSRKQIAKDLRNFFIFNFDEKQAANLQKRNYKSPEKKCFLDWGRELLDDVMDKRYIGIVVSVIEY